MAKIHVLGGPGSGKTTLAKTLAQQLDVPSHDLDLLGQKNGTDPVAHVSDAFAIAASPGWVVEGIYLVTTDPQFYEADAIVLLDVPWRVAAWRIVKRHVVKTLDGTNLYPGVRPLWNLLTYARRFYLDKNTEHVVLERRCLAEHATLPLPPTPERMVAFLETYHPVGIPPTMTFVRRYLERYQAKVVVIRNAADRERFLARYHR
jgi:adenylate kinase family enzyme